MKLALRVVLFLAVLSPAVISAQKGIQNPVLPVVRVNAVDSSMYYAPGNVAIRGRNLDFVTAVRLEGVNVPFTLQDKETILIQPTPAEPGFQSLTLVVGNRSIQAPIEFTPSLKAEWIRSDQFPGWPTGRLRLTAHPGASGMYMILYSTRRIAGTPPSGGVFHCQLLDLTVPSSGILTSGSVTGDASITFPVTIPLFPRPNFFAQTFSTNGLNACWSNLVEPMVDMP